MLLLGNIDEIMYYEIMLWSCPFVSWIGGETNYGTNMTERCSAKEKGHLNFIFVQKKLQRIKSWYYKYSKVIIDWKSEGCCWKYWWNLLTMLLFGFMYPEETRCVSGEARNHWWAGLHVASRALVAPSCFTAVNLIYHYLLCSVCHKGNISCLIVLFL